MLKKPFNTDEVDGLMNTIIGKDTIITGTVDIKGALRVDGTVKGKIICSDCVTVGATGFVEADIESVSAVVAGRMTGNIVASDKIELQAKCEMDGDLKTKSLVIEQGAVFCGSCNMKNQTPDLGFLAPQKEKKEFATLQPKEFK
ncbi:MAG: polymer-forming cytoskeletal protein [candidate division Zixibacteria bacterium]|nr:polymer-forming cytoskeletal protein [candidate division Zixibacteria bacterium]